MAAATATAPAPTVSQQASPSTYVGDLAPEVTEAMLWDHFRKIGQVLSVRICVDFQTKRSLGYGYVNYSKPQEAQAAIEQLNGSIIANTNRPCRVDRIQRDPTARKSGVCNIVIKGIPADAKQEAIRELFGKYGRITSMNLPRNNDGAVRGYCYVNFEKEADAIRAVEEADNQTLESGDGEEKTILVERYKNLAPAREEEKKRFKNTFLRCLKPEINNEELLKAEIAKFGVITACQVRIPREHAAARGNSACIAFDTHEDAQAMCDAMDGTEELSAPGQKIGAGRFMSKQERIREREKAVREKQIEHSKYPNLYVKHLDDTVTDEVFMQVFNRYGEVVSARIMRDPTGQSREFGFVSFKDRAMAENAINAMSNSTELSHRRPLYIAHCVSKDARRAQIEQQVRQRSQRMPGGAGGMIGPQGGMGGPPGIGGGGGQQGPGGMGGPAMYNQQKMYQMNVPNQMLPRPMQQPPMMGGGGQHQMHHQMHQQQHGGGGGGGGMQHQHQHQQAHHMQHHQQAQHQQQHQQHQMHHQHAGVRAPGMNVPRPQVAQPQAQPALDTQYLSTLSGDQQKNVLGERLYEHIQGSHPQFASKITGMLLEMENAEILNLLESRHLLDRKVKEALDVLQQHNQG